MNDINEILLRHIEKTNKFHDEAIQKLSSIETHQAYTRSELNKCTDVCDDYKKNKNIIYGMMTILSAIGGFFIWLYSQLKH